MFFWFQWIRIQKFAFKFGLQNKNKRLLFKNPSGPKCWLMAKKVSVYSLVLTTGLSKQNCPYSRPASQFIPIPREAWCSVVTSSGNFHRESFVWAFSTNEFSNCGSGAALAAMTGQKFLSECQFFQGNLVSLFQLLKCSQYFGGSHDWREISF